MLLPTRRALLLGAGAAALVACTDAPEPGPPPPDPDVALREAAVARERALLAAYDRVLAQGGDPALAVLRAEHAVHLEALAGATPRPSPEPAAGALPDLRALERDAAAAHAAAVPAASGPLAALLAQLAASESAHLVVL